jgi:LEA14-like dessication related protein
MTFRDERRREKRVPVAFSGDFPVYRGFEAGVGPVEVKTLTIGGTELTMKVLFKNLNGFPVTLERLSCKLELVGRPVGEGEFVEERKVEGRGEAAFGLPLVLDFFEVGKSVYNGLQQPPVAVRVTGEAEVVTAWGRWRIPLEKSDKVAVVR